MKPPQLIISIFLGLLGITMIVHFDSGSKITAIATIFIGIVLVGVGTAGTYMYFKRRHINKSNK